MTVRQMEIHVSDPCAPLPVEIGGARPLEVEVGCGKGRFLTARAAAHPEADFLGIERMLGRVRSFEEKCRRLKLSNAYVLRLEALYTFWYMLPEHGVRRTYVFFPDPWPKRRHRRHRLFGPLFLKALWKRLETGGRIEFATDHAEYFSHVVGECFEGDARFRRVAPAERGPELWTEFETRFREQGLEVHSAAWEALPGEEYALEPLKIAPEDEPREGIARRAPALREGEEEE